MNLSFIKLDINIMNDTKVKLIRQLSDGPKLFELWIGILCLGMKSGRAGVLEIGDGIPFTDEALAMTLDIPLQTVKLGLVTFKKFKMIETFENESIYICNFEKHQELSKIKIQNDKNRKKVAKYRKKQKLLALKEGDNVTVTTPNVTGQTKTKTEIKTQTKTKTKTPVNPKVLTELEIQTNFIFKGLINFRKNQGTYDEMEAGPRIYFNKGKVKIAKYIKADGYETVTEIFKYAVNDKWWKTQLLRAESYISIKPQYLAKKPISNKDIIKEALGDLK